MSKSVNVVSDLSTNFDGPPGPSSSWEATRVSTIQEVREAQIESKKCELHREREEIDLSLVSTDVNLQKQVRTITKECGKLRLEVAWLERDLSDVIEEARHQILQIQTGLQEKKLKLRDSVHASTIRIQSLHRKIADQRDTIAQHMIAARSKHCDDSRDVTAEIDDLNTQIDAVRRQIYQSDRYSDEATREASQTREMLCSEILSIESREAPPTQSLERQRQEQENLRKKLEAADRSSNAMREKVKELAEARMALRNQLDDLEKKAWAARVHGFN
jgi:chromosome segregation ATPase